MQSYDHKRIEKKWQRHWKASRLYRTREPREIRQPPGATPFNKGETTPGTSECATPVVTGDSVSQKLIVSGQKCYVLDMFPYPSGDGLHVGHPKGYIATDVYSRMKRMQGQTILHPMGWDAFGLPAENYAIANKIHPRRAVETNIKRFKKQLELLGFNYDWEREINTTDPNYYRWTQWIFRELFNAGLVYRSDEPINWCPSCKTGLANEDLEDGKCERCGSLVEKRPIPQWVIRITDYAEKLLEGLADLNWPEHIKEQQRNWIGKSEGAEIEFSIFNSQFSKRGEIAKIKVFTTRADTLFGVTYLVLAPEHPFLQEQIRNPKSEILNKSEIQKYINEARQKTEIERTAEGREKTGVELRGIRAVNPANGEEIPVWIADYVLAEYGTGAIMAVPAHDERDFAFAQKYNLPVIMVICPHYPAPTCPVLDEAYLGEGHLVASGELTGKPSHEARIFMTEKFGQKTVRYKLRDWVFSRQRYWGEPIPLIFCENCKKLAENQKSLIPSPSQKQLLRIKDKGLRIQHFSCGEMLNPGWIAVPEDKLPVKLPKVESYEPTGTGESPLANIKSFVETKCPRCGGPARRETNTMPQWAGSSWYYLAYTQKLDSRIRIQDSRAKRSFARWLPVDLYVGGAEHATRHLIYARFWHKFLHDRGIVPTSEPFMRLQNVGLILASDGRKMSKRYGNVVNPDEIVERFGADSLRIYEMFMGPFSQSIAWSTDSLVGARRFLERVWRLREKVQSTVHKDQTPKDSKLPKGQAKQKSQDTKIQTLLHQSIKKVTEDIEALRFNTAVSALMILANEFEKNGAIPHEIYEIFLKLLAPFAPHLSEELWSELGHTRSIHGETWPQYDPRLIQEKTTTIVVQVNGKTRANFEAPRGESDEVLKERALREPSVLKWTDGKAVKKIIVVPNRLVNIVV